jgi:galactokinase
MQATECLKNGDVHTFGQLMDQSHASLRDDFEVSCEPVDLLVKLTRSFAGTAGARMTGAGFGGCTVALISTQAVDDYISQVLPKYEKLTGRKAEVYISPAVAGALCTPV